MNPQQPLTRRRFFGAGTCLADTWGYNGAPLDPALLMRHSEKTKRQNGTFHPLLLSPEG